VQLVISDAHEGLKAAIVRLLRCPWQRCGVHFLRDCLGHARKDQHGLLAALIRPIFQADSGEQARRRLSEAIAALQERLPNVTQRGVPRARRHHWSPRASPGAADGEFVCLGADGSPDFASLRKRLRASADKARRHAERAPATFLAFRPAPPRRPLYARASLRAPAWSCCSIWRSTGQAGGRRATS
jgi:hypothetical protein